MEAALWVPTSAECERIREFAHHDSGCQRVEMLAGLRFNTEDASVSESINIALVTKDKDGEFDDTDLADNVPWRAFKKGVPLTDDGRAIVDFHVFSCGRDGQLETSVTVFYASGRIVHMRGVRSESR